MKTVTHVAVVVASLPLIAAVAVGVGTAAQGRSGSLRQTGYIKASNPHTGDHFGSGGTLLGDSVVLSGDGLTLAVGAPNEAGGAPGINGDQHDTSVYDAGAVYVFTRRAAGARWTQQAYVKASNPQPGAEFGHVVTLSGDGNTLAVSASLEASGARGVNGNQHDASIPQAGAVYVFTRRGGVWSQQAYIKASNTGEAGTADAFGNGDQFGFSLSLSDDGNTLAVGANAEDSSARGINGDQADNGMESAGAVYVFVRRGGEWSQQAYVKTANTAANVQFGYAVALSADGTTLAASAFDEGGTARTINGPYMRGRPGSGAVYIFTRSGAEWTQQAYLKASNAEAGDSLGVAVSISDDGDTVAAGSLDEDCLVTGVNPADPCDADAPTDTSAGAAYVFVRRGSQWTQQAFIKASNAGAEDWFGARLQISGDASTLVVSAQLEDAAAKGIDGKQADDSAQEAGAVYVFTRDGASWSQAFYVKSRNNEAFDEFGSAVTVSRDGRTMAVGARGEDSNAKGIERNQVDNSMKEAGAVYVFAHTPVPPQPQSPTSGRRPAQ